MESNVSEKDKTETAGGVSGLQRGPSSSESKERERIKTELRKKITSIRQGHTTGGYCETEKLLEVEKQLHAILSAELEEAKAKHGYSPDPKFKHPTIRAIEVELYGLAFKPKLVVAE